MDEKNEFARMKGTILNILADAKNGFDIVSWEIDAKYCKTKA